MRVQGCDLRLHLNGVFRFVGAFRLAGVEILLELTLSRGEGLKRLLTLVLCGRELFVDLKKLLLLDASFLDKLALARGELVAFSSHASVLAKQILVSLHWHAWRVQLIAQFVELRAQVFEFRGQFLRTSSRRVAIERDVRDVLAGFGECGLLAFGLTGSGLAFDVMEEFQPRFIELIAEILHLRRGGIAIRSHSAELAAQLGKFLLQLLLRFLESVALIAEFRKVVFKAGNLRAQFQILLIGRIPRLAKTDGLLLRLGELCQCLLASFRILCLSSRQVIALALNVVPFTNRGLTLTLGIRGGPAQPIDFLHRSVALANHRSDLHKLRANFPLVGAQLIELPQRTFELLAEFILVLLKRSRVRARFAGGFLELLDQRADFLRRVNRVRQRIDWQKGDGHGQTATAFWREIGWIGEWLRVLRHSDAR